VGNSEKEKWKKCLFFGKYNLRLSRQPFIMQPSGEDKVPNSKSQIPHSKGKKELFF